MNIFNSLMEGFADYETRAGIPPSHLRANGKTLAVILRYFSAPKNFSGGLEPNFNGIPMIRAYDLPDGTVQYIHIRDLTDPIYKLEFELSVEARVEITDAR